METYLRFHWFLIPDGLRFLQLFFSCSLQLLRLLSGLFNMQATEQNVNSKTKYYLDIKQINSTHISGRDVPKDATVASSSLYCQMILL